VQRDVLRQGVDRQLDMAAEQIRTHGTGTAIRHMLHGQLERLRKLLAHQMPHRGSAAAAKGHRAGCSLIQLTSSLRLLAGTEGCTANTVGTAPI
jgi:hypothetical protein